MAISAVAATLIQSGTGSASASVSASAGNALIVGGSGWTASQWLVTRTGDTYTNDTFGGNAGAALVGISSAPNVAGGSVTCTINGGIAAGISAWALELSGLPTSSIRDATSPAVATGTSTTPTSNSLTNATADAVYIGAVGDDASGSTTVTPGSGYTDTVNAVTMKETNGATLMVGGLEFQIVASASARTATWTTGSQQWAAAVAVYRAASGGGAQDTPELRGRPGGLRGQMQMSQLLAQ